MSNKRNLRGMWVRKYKVNFFPIFYYEDKTQMLKVLDGKTAKNFLQALKALKTEGYDNEGAEIVVKSLLYPNVENPPQIDLETVVVMTTNEFCNFNSYLYRRILNGSFEYNEETGEMIIPEVKDIILKNSLNNIERYE
jgi:hypothetical protein